MRKPGPALPRRLEQLRLRLSGPAARAAAAATPPGPVERLASRLGAVFSITMSVALTLLVLGVAGIVVAEFRAHKVWLEPIAVPRALADEGVTPAVVSERIAQRIQSIRREYALVTPFPSIAAAGKEAATDLHLLGGGLSLQRLVRSAKDALGRPDTRITGEITTVGYATVLTVREPNGGLTDRVVLPPGPVDVDQLVERGTEAVLKLADPELLSSYLYSRDWSRSGTSQRFADLEAVLDFREQHGERGSSRVMLYRGLVHYFRGDFDKSLVAYEQVIATEPSIVDAYVLASYPARELGLTDRAIALLREARARGTRSAQTLERVAMGYTKLDSHREAYDAYVEALRADPSYDRARVLMSNSLVFMHRPLEALALLDSFVPRSPSDFPDYQGVLTWTLNHTGRSPGRITAIRERMEREFAQHFDTQWVQAEDDIARGRYDEAEERLLLLAAENPGWSEPKVRLAEVALMRGDYETARQRFASCATPVVEVARCAFGLGVALARQERIEDAVQQLSKVIQRDADYVEAYGELATLLAAAGRDAEAAETRAKGNAAIQRLAVPLPRL